MKRVPRLDGKLLTLQQAGREYGLSSNTLWRWVTDRKLPAFRPPDQRSIYVRRADLERFIEENTTTVTP